MAKVVRAGIPCDLASLARVPLRFAKGRYRLVTLGLSRRERGIPCELASLVRVSLRFAKGRLLFELAAFYEVVEEVWVGF